MAKRRKAEPPSGPVEDVDPRFAAVVDAFENHPDVTRGRMMSAYGLKAGGKIFAMLAGGEMVVKLPKARVDGIVASGGGRRFEPRPGRAMKEWLVVASPPETWVGVAREAFAFVSGNFPYDSTR